MFDNSGKKDGKDSKGASSVKSEKFACEYLSVRIDPNPLFKKAYQAWLSYYDQLEEFEQKTCQARTPEGIALPRAGEELRLCAQKSRLLRQELFQPLKALEIPTHIEESARELALKEHYQKWRKRKS